MATHSGRRAFVGKSQRSATEEDGYILYRANYLSIEGITASGEDRELFIVIFDFEDNVSSDGFTDPVDLHLLVELLFHVTGKIVGTIKDGHVLTVEAAVLVH